MDLEQKQQQKEQQPNLYKTLILGDPNTGKSTLIQKACQYLKTENSKILGDLTISNIFLPDKKAEIEIYDLKTSSSVPGPNQSNGTNEPGGLKRILTKSMKNYRPKIELKSSIHRRSKKNVKFKNKNDQQNENIAKRSSFGKADIANFALEYDAYILVYSINDMNSFNNLRTRWYFEVMRLLVLARPFIIVVGVGMGPQESRTVSEQEGKDMAKSINANYFEVSLSGETSGHDCVNIFEKMVIEVDRKNVANMHFSNTISQNLREVDAMFVANTRQTRPTLTQKLRRIIWTCNSSCRDVVGYDSE